MEDLYRYMREKMAEMHEARSQKVEIDCIEFMQLMKMLCYMMQIRTIVND